MFFFAFLSAHEQIIQAGSDPQGAVTAKGKGAKGP